MIKKQNEALDETLYAIFGRKLQQSKFDIFYYSAHFNRYTIIAKRIKYLIIGLTSLATGIWMSWQDISVVGTTCSITILLLQATAAVSEHFPFESRKTELRDMLTELEPLYLKMENDWRSIYALKVSNAQIQELIQFYDQKQSEIKRHYFKDDTLPECEKVRNVADKQTEEYFKYMCGR